jgi:hypothetical protein
MTDPDVRKALQAIIDCYGVGTKDQAKLLEHLGGYIMEARDLLQKIKTEEKSLPTNISYGGISLDLIDQNGPGWTVDAPWLGRDMVIFSLTEADAMRLAEFSLSSYVAQIQESISKWRNLKLDAKHLQ